jgi:GxxExxY protein
MWMPAEQRDPQTYAIIGAAMEVHRVLGPGFLERVYQDAMEIEFRERGITYIREAELTIDYKTHRLPSRYRADFLCYEQIIVETKAQAALGGADEAQAINYLTVTRKRISLLFNFGTPSLQWQRIIV